MSKKLFRFAELAIAMVLGGVTAFYRVSLAHEGAPLTFGGIGHPSGWLYLLIGLCLIGFIACALFLRDRQILTKKSGGRIYTGLLAISALTLFAAFALLLRDGAENLFQMVQLVFLAVCGLSMIIKIILGERHKLTGILSLFPVYYLCLFLLQFYRENAKNPVVQSFALEIITVISVLAALYAVASLKFEWPKVRQQIFCTLTAVYLLVMEGGTALLYPDVVLSVPGMTVGMLCVLLGFGVYIIAAFFQTPMQVVFEKTKSSDEENMVENAPVSETEDPLAEIQREELLRSILGDDESNLEPGSEE